MSDSSNWQDHDGSSHVGFVGAIQVSKQASDAIADLYTRSCAAPFWRPEWFWREPLEEAMAALGLRFVLFSTEDEGYCLEGPTHKEDLHREGRR